MNGGVASASAIANRSNKNNRAKAASFMGGEEDDAGSKSTSLFMPPTEAAAAEDLSLATAAGPHEDDDSDTELLGADDEGEDDARARAERDRDAARLRESKVQDALANGLDYKEFLEPKIEEGVSAPAPAAAEVGKEESGMEVDEKPAAVNGVATEEAAIPEKAKVRKQEVKAEPTMDLDDDEVDPLDAYMNSVSAEVKKVDASDRTKLGSTANGKKGVKLGAADVDGVLEDDEDQEVAPVDEFEKAGVDAAEIMACVTCTVARDAGTDSAE